MNKPTLPALIFALLCLLVNSIQAQDPVSQFAVVTTRGCAPLTTELVNNSQNADSFLWLFDGGMPATSTLSDPTVTFETPGNYPVTLIAENDNGSDTSTFSITVYNPPPVADFRFDKNGLEFSFENLSEGGSFYVWEFGDGNTSTAINPTHTYENEGVYMVRLTVINDCDSDTNTDVVVISNQVNIPAFTANDQIPDAATNFLPGVNLGYFPPWQDTQLADIAAGNEEEGVEGVGVKTIRPLLTDAFLEEWGYDIRIDTYEHYHKIGLKDNTMIIGFPSNENRDSTFYCDEHQSEMFANLYEPIWDNGENGTPVNDDNPLALYLWRMVHLYGSDIKFYEVWNEPGFDYTFVTGYLDPGFEGNWWENNPDPCDYKLRAPIFHYIRTLRICYEVIKTIQPEAHIALGSVGYPSFMDAILRNTDNPTDGSPTSEYPLGGGAYFDVATIHSYPHFDGSVKFWNEQTQSFDYERHTDKAAEGIERTKNLYQNVLANYGYDDNTYPAKKWIITEIAVPRKQFGDFFGSDELQINYMIKSYVTCVKNDIEAMHVYDMAESHFYDDAISEFQLMGLFQRLFGIWPYEQIKNQQATAYKTTSDLLYGSTYAPQKEAELNLPDDIKGAAFLDKNGHYTYVLWAATTIDMSEEAAATYSFPASFNISNLEEKNWDFSDTEIINIIHGNNIELTGRPIFLTDKNNRVPILPTADFSILSQEGCVPMVVQFSDLSTTNTTEWNWSFPNGNPTTSTEQHPTVTYETPGTYSVTLAIGNTSGMDTITKTNLIIVNDVLPTSDFNLNINEQVVSFVDASENALNYDWDFGDGRISTEPNPTNIYDIDGFYDVTLITFNGCGSDTMVQTIIINPDNTLPYPDFTADTLSGCGPLTVQFSDLSTPNTTGWFWQFQGGTPNNSTEQNPVIVFENPGSYFVSLIASTNAGSRTEFKENFVTVTGDAPEAIYTFATDAMNLFAFNNSINADNYLWDFGDGNTSTEVNPSHVYQGGGIYDLSLIAYNECGSDTLTNTITISEIPVAGFEPSTTTACIGDTIFLISQSSGNTENWNWNFPNGTPTTSTAANPFVTYNNAGSYDVELIVSNGSGNDTLLQENIITIANEPQAGFNFNTDELTASFLNASLHSNDFHWDFGDGNTSMDVAPVHTYEEAGMYTVTLTVQNACDTVQISENLEVISTGIALPPQVHHWSVFPNPTDGIFSIQLESQPSPFLEIHLYDVLGRSVLSKKVDFQNGRLDYKLDVALMKGAYILVVETEEVWVSERILVW